MTVRVYLLEEGQRPNCLPDRFDLSCAALPFVFFSLWLEPKEPREGLLLPGVRDGRLFSDGLPLFPGRVLFPGRCPLL